jgi:hypothetical protein
MLPQGEVLAASLGRKSLMQVVLFVRKKQSKGREND